MLSDNQLEHIGDQFAEIFQELEQDVINDIARRLKKSKRWTETAELQAEALRELGFSPYEIQMQVLDKIKADPEFIEEVTANTIEYKKTVKELIDKAVAEGKARGDDLLGSAADACYRDDLRLWQTAGKYLDNMTDLGQVIAFYQRQLQQSINNLTRTTGFAIRGDGITPAGSAYQHELNKALIKSTSGAFTSEQAIQDAISKLAESGLRYVSYSSGVARNLDTTMRLAIRTTSAQMAGEISMNNLKDTGEDLVEVSYHAGARNEGYGHMNHAQWQGKVYSISGRPHPEESLRLGYRIEKLEDATGYPSDPLGLCGYNCRHTFYPFFEDISEPNPHEEEPKPFIWHGKSYDRYHAEQKQRQLEREIRAIKRQTACGDDDKAGLLKNKELQYRAFSDKAGLPMNINRLEVVNTKSSLHLLDR